MYFLFVFSISLSLFHIQWRWDFVFVAAGIILRELSVRILPKISLLCIGNLLVDPLSWRRMHYSYRIYSAFGGRLSR